MSSTPAAGTRFLTVFKKGGGGGGGRQVEEAEVVEHYERIQNLGYSHHNRGVGLGFGGMHAAAPPASLLRQCAQVGDRRQKPPPQPAAGSEAATYERWQRQLQQPQPQPTFSPLTRHATPTPLS